MPKQSRVVELIEQISVFLQRNHGSPEVNGLLENAKVELNGFLPAKTRLYNAILENGGQYSCLSDLAIETEVNYSYAWNLILELEQEGKITIIDRSSPPKPIRMIINAP